MKQLRDIGYIIVGILSVGSAIVVIIFILGIILRILLWVGGVG